MAGLHFRVPLTLTAQLAELKLKPDDIRYVALSHLHADHTGNAALFPHAIFLVSHLELGWASASPTPDGVLPDRVAAVQRSRIEPVKDDKDVFGDGTMRMLTSRGGDPYARQQSRLIPKGQPTASSAGAAGRVRDNRRWGRIQSGSRPRPPPPQAG